MLFYLVGKMRALVVFAVVASLQFLDALPLNGNVYSDNQNHSLLSKLIFFSFEQVSKAAFSKEIK